MGANEVAGFITKAFKPNINEERGLLKIESIACKLVCFLLSVVSLGVLLNELNTYYFDVFKLFCLPQLEVC